MSNQNSVIFEIEKLGAIRNSSFELSPFMVFSGESGLGKSYTAFLVHYLYVLITGDRLNDFFKSKGYNYDELITKRNDRGVILSFGLNDLIRWIRNDALIYLRFILGNDKLDGSVNIKFSFLPDIIEYKCEEEAIGVGAEAEVYRRISLNGGPSLRLPSSNAWEIFPFKILLEHLLRINLCSNISETFMMPPSRGALVGLTARAQGLVSATAGMYSEFLSDMDKLSMPAKEQNREFTSPEVINVLKNEINRGTIERIDGKIHYFIKYGTDIPLSAAVSSIKELAPLSLLLNKYSIKNYSILFEEPEVHLHPQLQVKVADLIAAIINEGAHFQITTHSDYFIRRINDLIILHHIKTKTNKNEFEQICKKFGYNGLCALNPKLVGAYFMKQNEDGTVAIIKQNHENGIPYDSFHSVIEQVVINSMSLKEEYEQLTSK
ncbi:MAG: hypothetical protein EZS26_000691 [Candidatus Ordinivivax streblomastigis]|uniref:Endonuclease GajA/Old nuclease/RecF-like AAA domain-containing protein n=1 Tax=Candidatus Ordinivivax streblomastigis TaxID=2540710 RepID=A0A5M8P3X8_9BACT|nr:MAG: hypothetical protein EZS26_000691 [Candidatus Ordinivivax streblomastigis]